MYKINKLKEYIAQGMQPTFYVTLNGIQSKKILNHYVVYLTPQNIVNHLILQFKKRNEYWDQWAISAMGESGNIGVAY